jgi:predicted DNA-binding transcriptional regulator AlpA
MKATLRSQTTLLDRRQVARRLGISTWTVWSWVKKGILPKPVKLGPVRMHRWREIDLLIFLQRKKADGRITARVPMPPAKVNLPRRRLSNGSAA